MGGYKKSTVDSINPLKKFSHRSRLKKGLKFMNEKVQNARILDYGCGDGNFLFHLSQQPTNNVLIGFEPFPESCGLNVQNEYGVTFFTEKNGLRKYVDENSKFDYITCFEVLEHCHSDVQKEILDECHKLLNNKGEMIISVPIEIGPASLVKNMARYRIGGPEHKSLGYNFKNIVKSVMGKPIEECRNHKGYLPHMGFYFQDLEKIIKENFVISKRSYSPFPMFNHWFNSQVFYSLKKK